MVPLVCKSNNPKEIVEYFPKLKDKDIQSKSEKQPIHPDRNILDNVLDPNTLMVL